MAGLLLVYLRTHRSGTSGGLANIDSMTVTAAVSGRPLATRN